MAKTRKDYLYEQELSLIEELDILVDQPPSEKLKYKKQRLDRIYEELQQLRAAELKEKEHAMAMQIKDKEIQKIQEMKSKEILLKEKEIELKKIESETAVKIKRWKPKWHWQIPAVQVVCDLGNFSLRSTLCFTV